MRPNSLARRVSITTRALLHAAGINRSGLKRLSGIARFAKNLGEWHRKGGKVDVLFPILGEWGETAGSPGGHYFHQDLLVARYIFENAPLRHVDVGSRIDGFVAHVATFREIEVIDIRPLPNVSPRIKFLRADIMQLETSMAECCDSLSCLHAIEHFGLGRYGDPINPKGHKLAFRNLTKMLKPQGVLYVSFPIGSPRVEFNAHRVFSPEEILSWEESRYLQLEKFDFVDDGGDLRRGSTPGQAAAEKLNWGCGIYTFKKLG